MPSPVTDPSVIEGYLTDASNVQGHADGLVRPRTTEEVSAILRHCQAKNIPVTVSAGRTSTTAAAVPQGGWVLSMERLNQIHHIGHDTAEADGGVFLGAFQTDVENTGRFFPPDPTSRHECSLGAAIACNASGARSFRYGPIRPWVLALTVVLPNGEIIHVKRGDAVPASWPSVDWVEPNVKTAAGYAPTRDAVDLFIGQEGTLGVITRATVRLTDLPADVMGVLAYFPSRAALLGFVDVARRSAPSPVRSLGRLHATRRSGHRRAGHRGTRAAVSLPGASRSRSHQAAGDTGRPHPGDLQASVGRWHRRSDVHTA